MARNVVYAEIGGNGLLGSVNVERSLAPGLALRVGATYWGPEDGTGDDALITGGFAMPVMAVLVTGKQSRHFEAGIGAIASTGGDVVPTVSVGTRFQRPGPGLVFRIGLVGFVFRGIALPFAGASLGYAF